jgi:hypothetical protein
MQSALQLKVIVRKRIVERGGDKSMVMNEKKFH